MSLLNSQHAGKTTAAIPRRQQVPPPRLRRRRLNNSPTRGGRVSGLQADMATPDDAFVSTVASPARPRRRYSNSRHAGAAMAAGPSPILTSRATRPDRSSRFTTRGKSPVTDSRSPSPSQTPARRMEGARLGANLSKCAPTSPSHADCTRRTSQLVPPCTLASALASDSIPATSRRRRTCDFGGEKTLSRASPRSHNASCLHGSAREEEKRWDTHLATSTTSPPHLANLTSACAMLELVSKQARPLPPPHEIRTHLAKPATPPRNVRERRRSLRAIPWTDAARRRYSPHRRRRCLPPPPSSSTWTESHPRHRAQRRSSRAMRLA
ncbi:uncharacterized protein SCHCODRAFT_02082893 [Schizophyllum commune H4-8]|nr:uncharacterized protein SCHCODRAFT_02082441 [Schizophyllum commune H4-8]XP_050197845.1 uncharacterized protein SCHCODRAFT_02082893 [Schizophyllum commune H4-8]KAI5886845.1 hypothetical protein SCHCODRAFT_02082441 [Schizophyllum commune H4-8]KAI5886853.1 hypothetical protein SCHCODRAFT_02082893 [Schizophyllum commune H4-8]